ncbi:MAG: hypothetical protein M1828_000385 [Chrysothrix sp. TS-e1954]|nr:MAG: hypothetical protein M1828_000385 [Chrysothrix sp. TS-e1954]
MADVVPQGQTQSYPSIDPTMNSNTANGNASGQAQDAAISAKDSAVAGQTAHHVVATAQSTMNSVQNSEAVQQLSSGPMAQNAKDQAAKTSSEFQNLANARATPDQPAATGQSLTHYHSMFYSLLSWENPRASAIAFASTVIFIFMARYLHILRYALKVSYITLGVTAALEVAGKLIFDSGLASRMRPKKYYTIPRESLERSLEDVEQLLNFFVIESQRVVFAENVNVTIAVFFAALLSYGLIKVVPLWGLSLIGTCVIYLGPLIYLQNRETIDDILDHGNKVITSQASQIRDLTAQHTARATDSVKSYAGEYSSKASEYMGGRKPGNTPLKSETLASNADAIKDSMPSVPTQSPSATPSYGQAPIKEEPVAAQ